MIAQTPPMGWNSWDCYGAAVTEETVRKNLTRLGDTVFTAEERDMEVTFGGAVFLPVSSIIFIEERFTCVK